MIESTKKDVFELLKKTIRPEFLNRIDDIIMFTPLEENQIKQIVRLQMNSVKKQLEANGITLETTDNAVAYLAKAGFDPEFGARPVKRAIQDLVLNTLSKDIIAQKIDRNRPIVIDADANGLKFNN